MLEIMFFTKNSEITKCNVSDEIYERLAKAGFGKIAKSEVKHMIIEEEEDDYDVISLEQHTRNNYRSFIEKERHLELKRIISKLDSYPTIQEFRENYSYIKSLTQLYDLFDNENNIYLWIE